MGMLKDKEYGVIHPEIICVYLENVHLNIVLNLRVNNPQSVIMDKHVRFEVSKIEGKLGEKGVGHKEVRISHCRQMSFDISDTSWSINEQKTPCW